MLGSRWTPRWRPVTSRPTARRLLRTSSPSPRVAASLNSGKHLSLITHPEATTMARIPHSSSGAIFRAMLCLGVMLGAASGCTHSGVETVDFRVNGGLAGNGDGTPSLHIEPDGAMTRTSTGGVTQTATLAPGALADLHGKIEAAEFPQLAPTYTACADCYVNVVTVQLGGATYSVRADTDAQVPAQLDAGVAT